MPVIILSAMILYALLFLLLILHWLRKKEYSMPVLSYSTKVSVIVCARNEENIIGNCLKALFSQDYPQLMYEVIAVDDASEDATLSRMQEFSKDRENITIVALKNEPQIISPKKRAITEAVKRASGELIILTDADCIPVNTWISSLVSFYEKDKPALLAGPVVIGNGTSFLEKFQSLEFCGLSLTTAAGIFMNRPLMCNGANMAFPRHVFFKVNGYEGVEHIASGDDVFLMNKIQREFPGRIRYVKTKKAIVQTAPIKGVRDFIQQRIRWASKGKANPNVLSNATGLFVFTGAFLPVLCLGLSLITPPFIYIFWAVVGFKLGIDFLYLYLGCKFFGKRKNLWFFIPAELFHILYVNLVVFLSLFSSSYRWKKRVYNN